MPGLARRHQGDTGETEGRAQALSQHRAASGVVHGRRRYLQLLREAVRGPIAARGDATARAAAPPEPGKAWGQPRLPAPSGRNSDPQPPPRAARGRAEGDAPGPDVQGGYFTCSRANGAGNSGEERRAGPRARAQPRRGGRPRLGSSPPGTPSQGTGRMLRGMYLNRTLLLSPACGMGLRGFSLASVKRAVKEW